jgi:predicted RNA-binding Zn-ribbon protein involved in translation (DUF1610 family)
MLFAIDKFKIGSEKEISAKSLYGRYIPNRDRRFFCPECGEKVFWRSRGGAHPDMFYHEKKTENSPECDKRVDGNAGLYLYQRIGLPMYLYNSSNIWKLEIGFPALGNELLKSAEDRGTIVCIKGGGEVRKHNVNTVNFHSDAISRIAVDIVPCGKEKYEIEVQSAGLAYVIRQRWSDYSDGIATGAFFQFPEDGGKRIKYGDSISPGKEYYLVAQNFNPPFLEVESKIVGQISLSNKIYKVYVVKININSKNGERYRSIDEYLKRIYGIGLLDIVPSLVPLWPPVVDRDIWIPVNEKKKIICAIVSGNEEPTVYQYYGNSVVELTNYVMDSGKQDIEIVLGRTECVISIDRKYVGREQIIKTGYIDRKIFSEVFDLMIDDEKVDLNSITKKMLSDANKICSNTRKDIAFQDINYCFQIVKVREKITKLPIRQNAIALCLLSEDSISKVYRIVNEGNIIGEQDDKEILKLLKEKNRGIIVMPPSWLNTVVNELKESGYEQVVTYLKECIRKRRVTHRLLVEIKKLNGYRIGD